VSGAWGLRQALVDELCGARCLTSARLEAALRSVPRHLFLPHVPVATAYRNEVVPLRLHQGIPVSTASTPEIVAIMLEQLGLEPGHRVLEIGAGSGYAAGLIAEVVGRGGRVVTIDLDEDLAALARRNLDAAGFEHVRVVAADGMLGDPDDGDFDRIIATVGAWDIAPAWRRQLAAGGRLVVPLSLRGPQRSIAFASAGERLHSTSIENCDFVWLRGELAGPGRRLPLGAASGLSVWLDDDRPVDPAALYARLRAPAGAQPSGVVTTGPEVFGGLLLWLALHDPGYCEVFHAGSGPDADLVPGLFGVAGRYRRTSGVLAGGHAVSARSPVRAALHAVRTRRAVRARRDRLRGGRRHGRPSAGRRPRVGRRGSAGDDRAPRARRAS